MEIDPPTTDLLLEDLEYEDVNNGGVMLVEDSKERDQENTPPPVLPHQDTLHLAPVFWSLIPIEDLAPMAPVVEVVDIDAEG
jgi:hypothetical protein